jgi:magnesium transporter
VPFYDRRSKQLIQEEVDVFIGQNFFITLHSGRLKVLRGLFDEVRKPAGREEHMGKGSGFLLYELVSRMFEHSLPMLDKIATRINAAEREILAGNSKAMTEELSYLKLEIINFRRIIRPQRALIQSLEDKKLRLLPAKLDIYFDDVLDTISRTQDLLDNYKEVAESLEDTNETFIQHRTNNVVKVLTLISLATLPGATISGLLAMNLRYPFPVNEATFFITVSIAVAVAVALFIFMYVKKWL